MSDRSQHDAALAYAVYTDRGLESITDLSLLKEAFAEVSKLMSPAQLFEEMCSTAYPTELLMIRLTGSSRGAKHKEKLRELSALMVENACCFDEEPVRAFADAYRSALVHFRLKRGDHRRAWDEVKAAQRGFSTKETPPGQPPVHGTAFELAASIPTLHTLIADVHQHMCEKGLVSPVRQALSCKVSSTVIYPTAPTVAGWPLAVAVAGVCDHGVKRVGQMVLSISGHLNSTKRRNKLFDRTLTEEGI